MTRHRRKMRRDRLSHLARGESFPTESQKKARRKFLADQRKRSVKNPMIAGKSIPWMWAIIAGGGMWWWWNNYGVPWRKLPPSVRVQYAMQPVQAESGKLASLQTYRLIENRRDGMTYTPVTSEDENGVVFTMPKAGTITRNVVVEGSSKYVEIA